MFCPNCGEQNSLEQKFCRNCGINLEQTAAFVREQSAGETPGSTGQLADGAAFEPVPSITERTTNLLEMPSAQAK